MQHVYKHIVNTYITINNANNTKLHERIRRLYSYTEIGKHTKTCVHKYAQQYLKHIIYKHIQTCIQTYTKLYKKDTLIQATAKIYNKIQK